MGRLKKFRDHKIGWWIHCFPSRYLLSFSLQANERCQHRNRMGWRCYRPWTRNYWCGLHNSTCWDHWSTSERHAWYSNNLWGWGKWC